MTHLHPDPSAAPVFLVLMWFGMMATMMAPTVWPWVRAFHRFQSEASATAEFVVGYFTAWLIYALGAATLQMQVGQPGRWWMATIFATAGLYQFSPWKQACLTHCRSPFSFFLARWRDGRSQGFRIGLGHGLFCVGCCWALMATSIAAGMANVWWMIVISIATFIEQTVSHGHRVRIPLGVGLILAAIRFWGIRG
jgi:predicted metal-binding membrane protein